VNALEPATASSVEALLSQALAAGAFRCGEILVEPANGAGCELRHRSDAGRPAGELMSYAKPEAASEIALYTDADVYRPLKTAPNLRRGWRLGLQTAGALRLALDLFYPGRLGAFLAFGQGRLRVTNLRATLGRQSGMYRVTQKLTDEQAAALVGGLCRSDGGCLRTILWRRDAQGTLPSTNLPAAKYDPAADQCVIGEPEAPWIPLLCQEACNLLVAEARRVLKGE
jgi:sirohydrochlorin cobaltochelatase